MEAIDEKFLDGYAFDDGNRSIIVQYRHYDTSKTLSIRPDMNVFLIKLNEEDGTLQEREFKFLEPS